MNNTSQPTEKQKSDNNEAATVPTMTEAEMKEFISILTRSDDLQGDYAFNGLLFFFQSVNEAIKKSPVEAQNLMHHLQQHVFNSLMWESFWAFDAHRRKCHLIFNRTEPFVYSSESETEKTAEPPTAAEDLNEDSDEDFNLGTIEELDGGGLALALSGVLKNPNLPVDIYNGVKRGLNDVFNSLPVALNHELSEYEDSPEYLAKLIEYAGGGE